MQNQFRFIDLFAGIGGFYKALSNHGGICEGYSEINKDAVETYCENYSEDKNANLGDIKKIKELPEHDILTAGVPCQSWSIAGKNLGFDDDRGQLWNDTIYLLKQSQPKAFIFENVKGLVDPRNRDALNYILERIEQAGYYASYHVVNSFDYGVAQNRIRLYIVGFKEKKYFDKFRISKPLENRIKLADILGVDVTEKKKKVNIDLFGDEIKVAKSMSLSSTNGYNDYFLFNDLRNGDTTIHSWDILETTDRQKEICYLLLKNRRKNSYGKLDGNPLSLEHFKSLDSSIVQNELDALVELKIFKEVNYVFKVTDIDKNSLTDEESEILNCAVDNKIVMDKLKTNRTLKIKKISIPKTALLLQQKGVLEVDEVRYDFKNTKISTGLFGVNRIFLPNSDIFPTLVASDTNDYVTLEDIPYSDNYREDFLEEVYNKKNYRKITKQEACLIQGFPSDFKLPDSRARWMKLIGNSVSVPVIDMLVEAILDTNVLKKIKDKSK
ncbi:MAG TPA: DNA (cytosine-5-)-methyltransferase [Campylobacterales bacterium]|nr:DNA (cytosine-5-)-methyltransferase [Campylobacterales bacterium]HIP42073.1 DNA (cytosine-5-)-methyltransferase [Campylobacterales bacterium]